MKRLSALCAVVLACAVSLPAQAHGYYGGPGFRGGFHHHGGWRHDWVGPVLGAAIVGGALYAASTPSYAAPQVIAVPPQPPRVAYYCSSWGQYYPAVQTCPVPWQLVSY
jgi:hypothetical protein